MLRDEKVDVALLDGTFYSPDELPDRDVSKIKPVMEKYGPVEVYDAEGKKVGN